ncbi:hypothetical protein LXL04_015678 [Taraxacum kok-saghyz]
MTSLKSSKKVWAPNNNKTFYTGPGLFLSSERESKELEMGGYGNATVSTTDLLASSSRQAQDNDEADLEGNESEGGDVDEQARKPEIDFNFKDIAKAKKNLKKLLESGVKEYPESNELKERIGKHISEFGGDKRPEGDDESNEGDKTPIHDPSHTSVTTPDGQDSISKENNADKGKQIINEGCVEGRKKVMKKIMDVIYRNKFNDSVFKGVFESMIPGSYVHATAIDIWAMQLSYTEQFRSRTSPVWLFMPYWYVFCNNMVFDERYTKDEWFKVFDTRMNQHLEKYREFGDIHKSHLVFFPVLKSEHFYLIVCNLKRIVCAVIDNMLVDVPMDAKYGTVPLDMICVSCSVCAVQTTHRRMPLQTVCFLEVRRLKKVCAWSSWCRRWLMSSEVF